MAEVPWPKEKDSPGLRRNVNFARGHINTNEFCDLNRWSLRTSLKFAVLVRAGSIKDVSDLQSEDAGDGKTMHYRTTLRCFPNSAGVLHYFRDARPALAGIS